MVSILETRSNPLSKRCKEWLFSGQVIESTSISGLLNQRIEDKADCFLDLGFIQELSNSNTSDLNVKTTHLVVTVSSTIFTAFESLPNIDQKISTKDILCSLNGERLFYKPFHNNEEISSNHMRLLLLIKNSANDNDL